MCNPFYHVLIGPPSHWSPSVTLGTELSLVPISLVPQSKPGYTVLIGSPISLVSLCNPFYHVLIGPPSHWSTNVTLDTQFSSVPHFISPPVWPFLTCSHWFPMSLVPPYVTLGTQFSVVPHLSGPPTLHGYTVCIVGLGDKPFHPMNNLVMEMRACDANACISLNAMRIRTRNANAHISSNANTCISMLGECAH